MEGEALEVFMHVVIFESLRHLASLICQKDVKEGGKNCPK